MRNSRSDNFLLKTADYLSLGSFLPLFGLIIILILLKSYLLESLWLDETISIWIAKDSLIDTFYRATFFQGQSPFYYTLVWLVTFVIGDSTLAVRCLSLFITLMSLLTLYKIARRFVDKETSVFCLLVFICVDETLISAGSARPYALALMFSLLSFYNLIEWQESQKFKFCLYYLICSALTLYSHYLFAGVFLIHIIYVFSQRGSSKGKFFIDYSITLVLSLMTLTPVFFQCIILMTQRESLSFAKTPDFLMLLKSILPFYILIYFVFAGLFCKIVAPGFNFNFLSKKNRIFYIFLVWAVSAQLISFIYSRYSGNSLFVTRYFLWTVPGLALLLGIIVDHFRPLPARNLFISAFFILVFSREITRKWEIENWQGAVAAISQHSQSAGKVVLIYSGLIESERISWLLDSEKVDYLLSPLSAYEISGIKIPLPSQFEKPAANQYFLQKISPVIRRNNSFYLICLDHKIQLNKSDKSYQSCENLIQYFNNYGYQPKILQDEKLVKAYSFNRKM